MSSHITIPELEERGLSYKEFFKVLLTLIKYELKYLGELHNSTYIDDIDSYILCNARRIHKTANTLCTVIEKERDFTTANAILRMLADSLASLYLIYNEDGDLLELRHYLYIIDGTKSRLCRFPKTIIYNDKVKREEYDSLCKQIMSSKQNYEDAFTHCVDKIHSCQTYQGHAALIDKFIEYGNWKFKNLSSFNMNKNKYSWSEMYKNLTPFTTKDNCSFLSEYIHGLSTCNMFVEIDNTVFEPIYGIATALLGRLLNFIHTKFNKEQCIIHSHLINALFDEDMPKGYAEQIINQFCNTHTSDFYQPI